MTFRSLLAKTRGLMATHPVSKLHVGCTATAGALLVALACGGTDISKETPSPLPHGVEEPSVDVGSADCQDAAELDAALDASEMGTATSDPTIPYLVLLIKPCKDKNTACCDEGKKCDYCSHLLGKLAKCKSEQTCNRGLEQATQDYCNGLKCPRETR